MQNMIFSYNTINIYVCTFLMCDQNGKGYLTIDQLKELQTQNRAWNYLYAIYRFHYFALISQVLKLQLSVQILMHILQIAIGYEIKFKSYLSP